MADRIETSAHRSPTVTASETGIEIRVHPAWLRLMRYCAELRHGEIEKLKIQDGVPMVAEVTTRKVKFSP